MTDTKPSPWAIRILAHGSEPAGELLPNDSNWRRHSPAQQRALGAAIGQVGLVAEVIVNLRSAESWGDKRDVKVLVDGHLRAALALLQGESTELPVGYVDLAPDEERLVLASLDPIGAMATADQAKLSELLAALDSQDDQVRGLLEQIARQQHVRAAGRGRPARPRRGARAAYRLHQQARRSLASGPTPPPLWRFHRGGDRGAPDGLRARRSDDH